MRLILAIDPGPVESALVLYDPAAKRPVWARMQRNEDVDFFGVEPAGTRLAIEKIASYGMAVGESVFETCVVSGRLLERWEQLDGNWDRIPRMAVKMHLCGSSRARDSNIRQALIDRYGGTRAAAIGTKKAPGPLYGFADDLWAALALAVTAAETKEDE